MFPEALSGAFASISCDSKRRASTVTDFSRVICIAIVSESDPANDPRARYAVVARIGPVVTSPVRKIIETLGSVKIEPPGILFKTRSSRDVSGYLETRRE